MQMLALLKHSYSEDYLSNITTLLTDLGATQSEVSFNSIYSKINTLILLTECSIYKKICFQDRLLLMQVKSIAECSPWSILQYFRPSLSYHLSLRSVFCLFLSGRFTQVYCIALINFDLLRQGVLILKW